MIVISVPLRQAAGGRGALLQVLLALGRAARLGAASSVSAAATARSPPANLPHFIPKHAKKCSGALKLKMTAYKPAV